MSNHVAGKRLIAPPAEKGDPVAVVRWRLTDDGWRSDLEQGRFWSATSKALRIIQDGLITDYPRSEWELCLS